MRYCENETVEVYETTGQDLGVLLWEAAGLIEDHDGYAKVATSYDVEAGYVLTVYLHR